MIKTIEWTDAGVVMIDQRRLPNEELYPVFKTYEEVAGAIEEIELAHAGRIPDARAELDLGGRLRRRRRGRGFVCPSAACQIAND